MIRPFTACVFLSVPVTFVTFPILSLHPSFFSRRSEEKTRRHCFDASGEILTQQVQQISVQSPLSPNVQSHSSILFNNLCHRVVDSLDIFIPSPLFAKMFIGQGTAVNATISSTSKTCVSKCGLGNGDEQR